MPFRLIPSMDLLGGRVVRLRHGDPDQATYYETTPEAWISGLVGAGAQRIHLVDLEGAFGRARQEAFRSYPKRWPEVRFQWGGGLRSRAALEEALELGFDPVVGTLALEQPEALAGLPGDRVILALDLKDDLLVTRGWQRAAGDDSERSFRALRDLGFTQALVTDVGRDGTLEGPSLEATRRVISKGFEVQASGGIRDAGDLEVLSREPGVTGAIVGRALLEGNLDLRDERVRGFLGGV